MKNLLTIFLLYGVVFADPVTKVEKQLKAPFLVSIRNVINAAHRCNGVMISERDVLTTCDCILNTSTENLIIVYGTNSAKVGIDSLPASIDGWNSTDENSQLDTTTLSPSQMLSESQIRDVDHMRCHPSFDGRFSNNLALLTAAEDFDLTNTGAKPIDIQTAESPVPPHTKFAIYGWDTRGIRAAAAVEQQTLLKVTGHSLVTSKCLAALPRNFDNETEFCLLVDGYKPQEGIGGAPVVANGAEDGVQRLYGIISYGSADEKHGQVIVCLDLAAYNDWIEGETKDGGFIDRMQQMVQTMWTFIWTIF